jgi:hypothetical protein
MLAGMESRFRSARLKIARAKEHIADVYSRAQIFAQNHPHIVTVQEDSNTGNDVLCIAPADPLPDFLLLVLGDALHNLRSALDHAWVEMQVLPGPWSKFPIHQTKEKFDASINGLKSNGPVEEIKSFLADVVQPYRGGRGEMLVDLHDIDIKDKHILLIAHRQYTIVGGLKAIDNDGEEFDIGDWMILPFITTSQPFEGHRKFHLTHYGCARTEVIFGDGMPFKGRNVMPTLQALIQIVSGFLDDCESILER